MNINAPGGESPSVPANAESEQAVLDIRHLTATQLQQLGVSQLAYVKPVQMNGAIAFAIHGADGTPMAVAGDLEIAIAAIRQHEMVPALVH
jgi:hypothetical protein